MTINWPEQFLQHWDYWHNSLTWLCLTINWMVLFHQNLDYWRNSLTWIWMKINWLVPFHRHWDYWRNLRACFFSGKQLIDTIPSTLGLLTQLTSLDLFDNELTGTIPLTLGFLTQLDYLELYDNQFNGTIPSALCSISGIFIRIDCADFTCTCCYDSSYGTCPRTWVIKVNVFSI